MSYFTGPNSGGMAIDGAVTDATQGSVFFAGVDGVLSQDNSYFSYSNSTHKLSLGQDLLFSTGDTGVENPVGWLNVGSIYGLYLKPRGGSVYVLAGNSAPVGSGNIFQVENWYSRLFDIDYQGASKFTTQSSTAVPLTLQLAASQSADALQVKDSGGGTVLALTKDGMFNVTFDAGFRYSSTHYIVAYNGGAGQYFTNSVAGDVIVRGSAGKSVRIGISTTESLIVDDNATGGNTRLLVYDVDNGQMERVSVGAADSGGSGYKVLRIPN